jgi:hypothetical protein
MLRRSHPIALATKPVPVLAQTGVNPDEVRAILKEAYIWDYALADDYRIQHSSFIDKSHPEYKDGRRVMKCAEVAITLALRRSVP